MDIIHKRISKDYSNPCRQNLTPNPYQHATRLPLALQPVYTCTVSEAAPLFPARSCSLALLGKCLKTKFPKDFDLPPPLLGA